MPIDIDAAGFEHALENLIADLKIQSNLIIELHLNDAIRIADSSMAMHLFRIVQESLNNVIKHAEASKVAVTLGVEGSRGYISIRDDGQGFDTTEQASKVLGLRIMKHRSDLIDAVLQIESMAGEGTEIKCYFANIPDNSDS